jgi:hypothetical protein
MAITISTVDGAVELIEGAVDYEKSLPRDGPLIQRKFLCPWAHSNAAANAIMGISSYTGATIFRQLPLQCPESPNLYAAAVGVIEGYGAFALNDTTPTWEYAVLPVTFAPLPYDPGADTQHSPDGQAYPFCSFSVKGTSQFYEMPDTSFLWAADAPAGLAGKPIGSKMGVHLPQLALQVKLHAVPFFPWLQFADLLGKVNDATFMGMDPELMLFEDYDTQMELQSDGTKTQEVTLNFSYRPKAWNTAPDPTDGATWHPIEGPGGEKPYELANLKPLILGVTLA